MAQRRRVKLSANQRMDMWGRWKAGQSLHEIGRAFGKSHVVVHFLLTRHGGIAPTASALAAHAYAGSLADRRFVKSPRVSNERCRR